MSGDLHVALVGYGFAGRTFHAPLIGAVPGLRLTCVVSGDAGKVHRDLPGMRVERDAGNAIEDGSIDLVVIATPNDTHAALARAALAAGRHVVVDKPFVLSTHEARELAAFAASCGRMLSVFHNRRWDSDFLAVRDAIEAGAVGEVVHFESRIERFRPQVRGRWRERPGAGSGLWWDLGPHLVDQALLLFGIPDRVQADLAVQRDGAVVDDWAHVVLAYGARRVVLHAGMLAAGASMRFVVHGTHGSLAKAAADPQEAQLIAGLRPGDDGWGVDPDPLRLYDAAGCARDRAVGPGDQSRYYARVRDALLGLGENPVGASQAVAVTAVLEAAIESARSGRRVDVPLEDAERRAFG